MWIITEPRFKQKSVFSNWLCALHWCLSYQLSVTIVHQRHTQISVSEIALKTACVIGAVPGLSQPEPGATVWLETIRCADVKFLSSKVNITFSHGTTGVWLDCSLATGWISSSICSWSPGPSSAIRMTLSISLVWAHLGASDGRLPQYPDPTPSLRASETIHFVNFPPTILETWILTLICYKILSYERKYLSLIPWSEKAMLLGLRQGLDSVTVRKWGRVGWGGDRFFRPRLEMSRENIYLSWTTPSTPRVWKSSSARARGSPAALTATPPSPDKLSADRNTPHTNCMRSQAWEDMFFKQDSFSSFSANSEQIYDSFSLPSACVCFYKSPSNFRINLKSARAPASVSEGLLPRCEAGRKLDLPRFVNSFTGPQPASRQQKSSAIRRTRTDFESDFYYPEDYSRRPRKA